MGMLQEQAVAKVLVIVAVRLLQSFHFPKKDQAYLIREGCCSVGFIDAWYCAGSVNNGRDDWIRTSDLVVPNDARYQTAPHPVIYDLMG